jgi:hypothetical protein
MIARLEVSDRPVSSTSSEERNTRGVWRTGQFGSSYQGIASRREAIDERAGIPVMMEKQPGPHCITYDVSSKSSAIVVGSDVTTIFL